MGDRRFNPTLPIAFGAAVVLHAVVLPLVLMGVEVRPAEPLADLRVVSVVVPSAARAGETVEVWPDVRYEPAPTTPVFMTRTDRVLLSRDRAIDEADQALLDTEMGWTAGGGLVEPFFYTVPLPPDADGPYQVIFHADADAALPDADRTNNTRATPIYIDGPQRPELALTGVTLPDQAIAGGTALFAYTVENRGPGYASTPDGRGGWRDAVYLSTDTTLDENDLPLRAFARRAPLGPGETYAHQRVALDLPRVPAGGYHLILVADADQVLDQPSFTAGYATQPIELVDTGLPDLAVASITAPGTAVLGEAFTVRWEAANLGSVDWVPGVDEASDGREDAVYLSRDATLDAGDTLLTVQRDGSPLPAQSQRDVPPARVVVPNEPQHTPGDWHLIIVADYGGAIDEGPFEDNNAFAVPIVLLAPSDDAEPELGEPDNDSRLTVAWIEHERVEQHMARLTETVQPAIQNIIDPDPNAPLNREPRPPAPPSVALQPGGSPDDPARPVNPDQQTDARPRPPVPDAPDTNTAPRPRDPNAQTPEQVAGIDGSGDDLPMPRDGDPRPADADDSHPLRPDTAPRDDDPRSPGDTQVESDADPDAPDTDSQTDSDTPAERDTETDSNNPADNDSDQPSEVMDESAGDTPSENDPSDEPAETDSDGDADDESDADTAADDPAEDDSDRPEGEPTPPSNPSEEQETTRAPRDDAEADPVDDQPDRLRLEEGNVLVGQGVRVNTSRIRRGTTTSRLTAVPRDTRVRIVFNSNGEVVEARVLGDGTGYEDWDARLLEALYRWTAQGPDIDNADPHYTLELEYKFGLLNRRE